jgi:hypothetical protein
MAQPEVGSGQFGNGEEVFCVLFVARGQSDCGVPECVLMPRRRPLTGPSSIYRVRREKRSMVAADRASGSHPNSPIPIRFVAVGFGATCDGPVVRLSGRYQIGLETFADRPAATA